MAKRKASIRPSEAVLERYRRFRGLNPKQIRALIEIDELATHHDGMAEVTRRYREELGREITVAEMRAYADEAEARKHNGTASAWWESLADHPDATSDDRQEHRAFYLRVGWVEEGRKHEFVFTPDELRPIAERRLQEARRSDFDGRLRSALDLFAEINDREGVRRVLDRAVAFARHDVAERAAKALDRPLTRNELLRMARKKLARESMNFRDVAAYIADRGLDDLSHPLIEKMAGCPWVSLAQLRVWARRLNVSLTTRLLKRFYNAKDGDRGHAREDLVASARVLARRSKAWQRRLPAIYAQCRTSALSWWQPEEAERYGQLCGQPLTVAELREMAEYFMHDDHAHLDWARRGRAFCLDLLVRRIAEAAGAPPDPPATPLRRRSAQRKREPAAAA